MPKPRRNRPAPTGVGRFRIPRWVLVAGALVAAVILAATTSLAVLAGRPGRIDVSLHPSTEGTTTVVVGIDDRALAPEDTADFGELDADPGARADVIFAVRSDADGVRVASITRDFLVSVNDTDRDRLATAWMRGPQAFVDGLCRTLHMPVDHLVAINLRGFVTIVDALGGIEVTLEHPLRDDLAHIDLPAGTQTLDGATALGYVRSRQGEILVDGRWLADPEGSVGRQRRSAEVLTRVMAELPRDPLTLFGLAYQVLPEVSLDSGTSLLDLLALRDLPSEITRVPFDGGTGPDDWLVHPSPETHATLAELGMASGCQP